MLTKNKNFIKKFNILIINVKKIKKICIYL